mgnify:CR=1 FL=1|jgi:hypothetical protein
MSKRRLKQDYRVEREAAYLKLDSEHAEALWEDIELRIDSGLPVGQKARELVMRRREIKERVPKQ